MSVEAGLKSMDDVMPSRADVRNRLLTKMPASDFALLAPHLEMETLKERQVVEVPGRPITLSISSRRAWSRWWQ